MKYLSTLLLLAFVQVTFAQKMVIEVSPSSAELFLQSEPFKSGKKINIKTPSDVILATKDGYITNGYTFGDLKKMNKESFTIKLDKITSLPSGFNSKSMKLTKITDASGKVEKPDRPGLYGIMIKGTALNSPLFINGISDEFTDYGYNMKGSNDLYGADDAKSDLAIVADLKTFSKDTQGSGYQVSITVEWSVYSFSEKKVVYKITTAGYSDKEEPGFNNELASAFKDAVKALLCSSEFQAVAQ